MAIIVQNSYFMLLCFAGAYSLVNGKVYSMIYNILANKNVKNEQMLRKCFNYIHMLRKCFNYIHMLRKCFNYIHDFIA